MLPKITSIKLPILSKISRSRSEACHTCTCCGEARRAQDFALDAKECKTCVAGRKQCDVCQETKAATGFSRSQLHRASDVTRNVALRCQVCSFYNKFEF